MATNWINLGEAAEKLGVHPATLRAWADKGDIPFQRTAGGHRRFRVADVEAKLGTVRRKNSPTNHGIHIIVQNALGRARMELTGDGMDSQGWYERLDETTRHQQRGPGRELLQLMMAYLSGDLTALDRANQMASDYAAMSLSQELSLAETVRAYLFFRQFLFQALYDMVQAAGGQGPTDWGAMHEQVTTFTNELLIALIEAFELAREQP